MEGLLADLVIVAITLGAGLIGADLTWKYWKRARAKDPEIKREIMEEQGENNAKEYEVEESRKCSMCGELTDPSADLYMSGEWFHKKCFKIN
jgi:hypothetical protein